MQDNRLKEFLRDFIITDSQQQEIYKRYGNEIRKGLGRDTHAQADTKCFVTYVQDLPTGKEIGNYLALDLGGTNFRVLLVSFKGQNDTVVQSKIYALSKEIMTGHGSALFDHIAQCLSDFVTEHKVAEEHLPLGFTFSFPCVQLGLTKANLVRWTKGFNCDNVIDQDVAQLLKEAIARRGNLEIDVMAILNDTTGTLMSCAHRNQSCRIGVIVGTGSNICYVERVENVDLLEPELKQNKTHVLINTECGAFGDSGLLDFVRTEYDREVDKASINAGKQLFEKMISGMYLGELVRLILCKAIENKLIFILCSNVSAIRDVLANKECFETSFISAVESDTFPEFTNTRGILKQLFNLEKASIEDCQKVHFICATVAKRAAKLIGIAISSLINRIGESKVVAGVDGSVYRFHPKFDAYMRETMRKLVDPKISFDLMLSEDGSGRGAALVAAVASRK